MKPFKIIYYIFLIFIGAIAILLVFSVFPITGNYKIMVVQSGSMTPAIKLGSVVLTKPAEDYKIGDVISFRNPENPQKPITHRIFEIETQNGETFYITKGDANNAPDKRRIQKRDILGKVLFDVPYLGYAVEIAKKPYGFLALILIPAAIIILEELIKIKDEILKIRQKKRAKINLE